MSNELSFNTGDIVTLSPDAKYQGKETEALNYLINATNENYKWVVVLKSRSFLEPAELPAYDFCIYPLVDRSLKMNEGAYVDGEHLTLVAKITNPVG